MNKTKMLKFRKRHILEPSQSTNDLYGFLRDPSLYKLKLVADTGIGTNTAKNRKTEKEKEWIIYPWRRFGRRKAIVWYKRPKRTARLKRKIKKRAPHGMFLLRRAVTRYKRRLTYLERYVLKIQEMIKEKENKGKPKKKPKPKGWKNSKFSKAILRDIRRRTAQSFRPKLKKIKMLRKKELNRIGKSELKINRNFVKMGDMTEFLTSSYIIPESEDNEAESELSQILREITGMSDPPIEGDTLLSVEERLLAAITRQIKEMLYTYIELSFRDITISAPQFKEQFMKNIEQSIHNEKPDIAHEMRELLYKHYEWTFDLTLDVSREVKKILFQYLALSKKKDTFDSLAREALQMILRLLQLSLDETFEINQEAKKMILQLLEWSQERLESDIFYQVKELIWEEVEWSIEQNSDITREIKEILIVALKFSIDKLEKLNISKETKESEWSIGNKTIKSTHDSKHVKATRWSVEDETFRREKEVERSRNKFQNIVKEINKDRRLLKKTVDFITTKCDDTWLESELSQHQIDSKDIVRMIKRSNRATSNTRSKTGRNDTTDNIFRKTDVIKESGITVFPVYSLNFDKNKERQENDMALLAKERGEKQIWFDSMMTRKIVFQAQSKKPQKMFRKNDKALTSSKNLSKITTKTQPSELAENLNEKEILKKPKKPEKIFNKPESEEKIIVPPRIPWNFLPFTKENNNYLHKVYNNMEDINKRSLELFKVYETEEMKKRNQFKRKMHEILKEWDEDKKICYDKIMHIPDERHQNLLKSNQLEIIKTSVHEQSSNTLLESKKRIILKLMAMLKERFSSNIIKNEEKKYELFYDNIEQDFEEISKAHRTILLSNGFAINRDLKTLMVIDRKKAHAKDRHRKMMFYKNLKHSLMSMRMNNCQFIDSNVLFTTKRYEHLKAIIKDRDFQVIDNAKTTMDCKKKEKEHRLKIIHTKKSILKIRREIPLVEKNTIKLSATELQDAKLLVMESIPKIVEKVNKLKKDICRIQLRLDKMIECEINCDSQQNSIERNYNELWQLTDHQFNKIIEKFNKTYNLIKENIITNEKINIEEKSKPAKSIPPKCVAICTQHSFIKADARKRHIEECIMKNLAAHGNFFIWKLHLNEPPTKKKCMELFVPNVFSIHCKLILLLSSSSY